MKLDIGCGPKKTGSEYFGLDVWRSPYVDILASAEALPFKSETFTEVYSRRCVQHIRNDNRVFSEVLRVLKKSGKAKIIVASWRGWLFYQIRWLFRRKPYALFHIYTFRKLKEIFVRQSVCSIKLGKIQSTRRFGYDIIIQVEK